MTEHSSINHQNSKFSIVDSDYYLNQQLLISVANAAFSVLGSEFEVNLSVVSEVEVQSLNNQYRGKNEPTDVLSFKLEEGDPGGDIVIAHEVAERQAQKAEMVVDEEMAFLLVHGLLHLAGYDHIDEAERKVMESLEDAILKEVKIEVKR